MNDSRHQNTTNALTYPRKREMETNENSKNLYLLADKHGMGDILNNGIPEPVNMDELNEQILAIEIVIRQLRKHTQNQFLRLKNLKQLI